MNEVIEELSIPLIYNRRARFLQKVGLGCYIVHNHYFSFPVRYYEVATKRSGVTGVMGLSLDGNVVFAAYLSLILPFISK